MHKFAIRDISRLKQCTSTCCRIVHVSAAAAWQAPHHGYRHRVCKASNRVDAHYGMPDESIDTAELASTSGRGDGDSSADGSAVFGSFLLEELRAQQYLAKDIQKYNFDVMLTRLKAYAARFGTTFVPLNYFEDDPLGRWTALMRQGAREGQLQPGQMYALDDIGFQWEPSRVRPTEPTCLHRMLIGCATSQSRGMHSTSSAPVCFCPVARFTYASDLSLLQARLQARTRSQTWLQEETQWLTNYQQARAWLSANGGLPPGGYKNPRDVAGMQVRRQALGPKMTCNLF